VDAVLADEVRQLDQKLSKPGILLEERVGLIGVVVTAGGRLILSKGIFKQRQGVIGRFNNPK
jgi:hypothetical protein